MPTSTIPGVKAHIQDGGLRPRSTPVQPKVTVIGTTNNPDIVPGEPIRVESDNDARLFDNKFASDGVTLDPTGPISKPSELTKAVAEAFNGGGDHVEVYALPDPTGTSLKLEVSPTPARRFDALAEAYRLLKFTPIDIAIPVGTVIDSTGLLSTQNFAYQLANFCHQTTINERAAIGAIATTPAVAGDVVPTLAQMETWVAGLEDFDTSGILGIAFPIGDGITDANADDVPDTYAFWATEDEAIPVGAPAPRFDADVEIDRKGQPVDLGKYISVVADTVRFINEESSRVNASLGYYHGNAVAAYAGLISSLPSFVGTTNQILKGATPVRPLAPSQVERLINKRYVSFINRPTGYVVADGITWAYRISDSIRSDFTQLTTFRITLDAISFVRTRAMRYIGQPSNAQTRAALNADVDEALSKMQQIGALQKYDFRVVATQAQQVLGRIEIELKLVPAFEIKTITVVAGVSGAL
jgi:hypothetical protein